MTVSLKVKQVGSSLSDDARDIADKTKKLHSQATLILKELADSISRDVKVDWPVRTGLSKRSFRTTRTSRGSSFDNTTDYAHFVNDQQLTDDVNESLRKFESEVNDKWDKIWDDILSGE